MASIDPLSKEVKMFENIDGLQNRSDLGQRPENDFEFKQYNIFILSVSSPYNTLDWNNF